MKFWIICFKTKAMTTIPAYGQHDFAVKVVNGLARMDGSIFSVRIEQPFVSLGQFYKESGAAVAAKIHLQKPRS